MFHCASVFVCKLVVAMKIDKLSGLETIIGLGWITDIVNLSFSMNSSDTIVPVFSGLDLQ